MRTRVSWALWSRQLSCEKRLCLFCHFINPKLSIQLFKSGFVIKIPQSLLNFTWNLTLASGWGDTDWLVFLVLIRSSSCMTVSLGYHSRTELSFQRQHFTITALHIDDLVCFGSTGQENELLHLFRSIHISSHHYNLGFFALLLSKEFFSCFF